MGVCGGECGGGVLARGGGEPCGEEHGLECGGEPGGGEPCGEPCDKRKGEFGGVCDQIVKETLCIFFARGGMFVSSPLSLINCFSAGFNILSFGKWGALEALCLTSLYSMYSCVISLCSIRT